MQIKNLRKEAKLMGLLDLFKLNNNNKQATTNDNSKKAIDRHKVEPTAGSGKLRRGEGSPPYI